LNHGVVKRSCSLGEVHGEVLGKEDAAEGGDGEEDDDGDDTTEPVFPELDEKGGFAIQNSTANAVLSKVRPGLFDFRDDHLLGNSGENRFLSMEAILGLLEDGIGMQLEDALGDFFLAVGGEAMKDDVVFMRVGEESFVDLIVTKEGFFFGLAFLAHGEPDVGVDDVGAFGGFSGVTGEGDVRGVEALHEVCGREAGVGGGYDEVEAEVFGGPHPGA